MNTNTTPNMEAWQEAGFEATIQQGQAVLVDLWAPWCGPCKAMNPTIEAFARDHADQVQVLKVNVDDHPTIAAEYGVRSIPTLLYFKDGELVGRTTGALTPPQLISAAQKNQLIK